MIFSLTQRLKMFTLTFYLYLTTYYIWVLDSQIQDKKVVVCRANECLKK